MHAFELVQNGRSRLPQPSWHRRGGHSGSCPRRRRAFLSRRQLEWHRLGWNRYGSIHLLYRPSCCCRPRLQTPSGRRSTDSQLQRPLSRVVTSCQRGVLTVSRRRPLWSKNQQPVAVRPHSPLQAIVGRLASVQLCSQLTARIQHGQPEAQVLPRTRLCAGSAVSLAEPTAAPLRRHPPPSVGPLADPPDTPPRRRFDALVSAPPPLVRASLRIYGARPSAVAHRRSAAAQDAQ